MLPCLAYEPYPTVADFQAGWRWWLTADDVQRRGFSAARLQLVRSWSGERSGVTCHSTGSTGAFKRYRWGPCYDALYAWFLHDLVRSGSRLDSVASLALLGTRHESLMMVEDTPWHPVVDRWIKIAIGPEPLTGLAAALAGHDVIVAPGHYEVLDLYAGFAGLLDPACLVLSSAEALSDYVVKSAADHGLEVRDWMRCWDGGASFYTCPYGSRHLVDMVAAVAVTAGCLVSSDLFNLAQPFLDYHNGDRVELGLVGRCPCGLDAIQISFANRQDDLYTLSPSGELVNFTSLSFLMGRAAADAGLPEQYDLLCFGYSKQRSLLELGYLRRDGTAAQHARLARLAADYGKALGFEVVKVSRQVRSAERKFKRFVDLDKLYR